jgi:lipopolysaccharide/colanic/teichoic acid biosynthesis glycosyltransferase
VIAAPVLLCAAIALKISAPREPLLEPYRAVGLHGIPFDRLRFQSRSGLGPWFARVHLRGLPQLFNVVRGEMSLVGPRPLPERDYEMLEDWHRKRYLVLPGLTGLWQVSGRSELDFDDLVHLDFIYLENWSLALDLTILLKTIPAVFTRRGAY